MLHPALTAAFAYLGTGAFVGVAMVFLTNRFPATFGSEWRVRDHFMSKAVILWPFLVFILTLNAYKDAMQAIQSAVERLAEK